MSWNSVMPTWALADAYQVPGRPEWFVWFNNRRYGPYDNREVAESIYRDLKHGG